MPLYALGDLAPNLPPSDQCFVAPDASLIGDVRLEKNASVWFGCVMRGDNEPLSVGEDTNIQDGSVCHADPGFPLLIGKGVTVGHKVMLHGCTIGDYSLIGMGAIVMNGAKIGRNCIIGAGALIKEGQEIPDNSLAVGAPAKVVRTLDGKTATMLAKSAEIYVMNSARFREGLKEIT